jgi:hypothetical protein
MPTNRRTPVRRAAHVTITPHAIALFERMRAAPWGSDEYRRYYWRLREELGFEGGEMGIVPPDAACFYPPNTLGGQSWAPAQEMWRLLEAAAAKEPQS